MSELGNMGVFTVDARTQGDVRARRIAELVQRRSSVFDAVGRAETTTEREQLFSVWRGLTHEIEVLQA